MNSLDTPAVPSAVDGINKGFAIQNNANEGPLMVTFSSAANPFLLKKMICSNLECEFYHLSFLEINESALEKGEKPMSFGFSVNIGQMGDKAAREDMKAAAIGEGAPEALATEFFDEFPEQTALEWYDGFKFNKEGFNQLQTYRLDKETLFSGDLVSFMDIYSGHNSVFNGGQCASFRFLHKGAEFFVDDMYCPNPACKCNEAILHFAELIRKENEQGDRLKSRFTVRFSFKGKSRKFDCENYSKNEAGQCLAQLQSQVPDLLNTLKDHYGAIKEIGKRSLEEADDGMGLEYNGTPVRKNKIGRNEPCECGSGKKYKKCCGA
ncbi:MAG: SEC-C metal-binding domain-containing protein [Exilibacterium sp.]